MVIQISYELKRPGQNYESLYTAIKQISGTWCHPMTSHWFIETTLSPTQVWNLLASHVDNNDQVLVIKVTNSPRYQGWLKQEQWNWLAARNY
jgi:hypothetical protein